MRAAGVLLVAVVGTGMAASPAAAADHRVAVAVAGPPADAARLLEILVDLLEPLGASVELRRVRAIDPRAFLRPASPEARLAWVAIDVTDRTEVRILLLDGARATGVVRELPAGPDGVDEVVHEAIAAIVSATVELLLDGAPLASSLRALRREMGLDSVDSVGDGEPPAAEDDRAAVALRLAAGLEGRLWSPRWPTAGVSLAAALQSEHGDVLFGAAVEGVYRFWRHAASTPLGARFGLGGLRMTSTLGREVGGVVLAAVAGVSLDVVRAVPRVTEDAPVVAGPARVRVDVGATVGVMLEVPWASAALRVRAGLDVEPTSAAYVLRDGPMTSPIVSPAPVRPWLEVGLAADVVR